MKTSEDVSEEDLKGMMQLVPVEEVYVEALEDLHQLWALVKETLSIRHATKDKEKELWVELKRLFEPDFEDQLGEKSQRLLKPLRGQHLVVLILNEKADEAVEENQEFRPMGRDRAKAKKKADGSSSGGSSFVDLVADKFYNMKQKNEE
nr:hypothetical protein [Tanacetum cinerariifolium]